MMTPAEIEAAARQADAERALSNQGRVREEQAVDAVRLARLLRERLGIELHPDTALTDPAFEIGRFRFTLEKRLAEIGAGYDYRILVMVTIPPEGEEQYGTHTSPKVVANLADLGGQLRFADSLTPRDA
jgi:hypothetical protein